MINFVYLYYGIFYRTNPNMGVMLPNQFFIY